MRLAPLLVLTVCVAAASAQNPMPIKPGSFTGIKFGGKGPGGGQPTQPGDNGGAGPSAPGGPKQGPSGAADAAGAARSGPGSGPDRSSALATGGADLEAITGGELVEDWWVWWEINKSLYLVPHEAAPEETGSRYASAAETEATRRAAISERLLPVLREMLKDDAVAVRASAATTLGRLGGDAAVDALLPALADSAQWVREATLLSLGVTGSTRAAQVLLNVARDGHVPDSKEDIGPTARPMAIVGLALGRQHGLPPNIDDLVAALLDAGKTETDVLEAGLLYRSLVDSDVGADLLQELAAANEIDIRLRCRVTEGLSLDDDTLLPHVLEELQSRNTDRRRAAAVTLARSASAFAFPRLQKAFEDEEEPLTRGLMLVSIGMRGGDDARDFLMKLLRRGRAVDRPWVALGLGLLARTSGDAKAREALREGLDEESSAQARGAWVLGCGLARDPEAGPVLCELLAEAADPRLRMFAALSLSMLRNEPSLAALRGALATERSPLARAGVVLAVALQGKPEDAARLIEDVREANNPLLQAQLASAVGLHDSAPAVDGLEALLVADTGLSDVARAATLDALGLLLDPREGFQLVRVATQRNFAVFPDWLARALTITTL